MLALSMSGATHAANAKAATVGAVGSLGAIRLTVPGTLAFRAVAVRVVAEACRLAHSADQPEASQAAPARDARDARMDLAHPFDAQVVSAFAEIYNNIAIHSYQRQGGGNIELSIAISPGEVVVEIRETGATFDMNAVPEPALDELPEGGMGIHIARAMLDDITYEPGPPNLWRLTKRTAADSRQSA